MASDDAYLLVSTVPDALADEFRLAEYEVRRRAVDAVTQLFQGGNATLAAARQMVRLRAGSSQRIAEANVTRAASRLLTRLPART